MERMGMKLPLNENQKRIFEYIQGYVGQNNYPPFIKEIQENVELKNQGSVHKCICALESKGWLKREKGKYRGIDIQGSEL